MKEEIEEILSSFLAQAETDNLTTSHFPSEYAGLKLKAGFGRGNVAQIAWIVFLMEDQNPQNGIFPVFYYFKEQHQLILAYGISETEVPSKKWLLGPRAQTVQEFFSSLNIKPHKYGTSYVYEVYDTNNNMDWTKIETDLNNLIRYYKMVMKNQ